MQSNLQNIGDVPFPQWDFKVMFLRTLHKTSFPKLGEYRINIYKKLLGNLDQVMSEFDRLGFLRKPTFIDCVENARTVTQLKEFLKSNGVKRTGNKSDLILRAINLFSEEEKKNIEENGFGYIITPVGWDLISSDRIRFQGELLRFQNFVIDELINGEYASSCNHVSDFYATYPFAIGMGTDWKSGFSQVDFARVAHIMTSKYLTDSMSLSEETNKKLRAIIAVSYLFSFSGFSDLKANEMILLAIPEFKCEEIERFLDGNPTGIFEHHSSENKSEVAEIFYHTIVNEAYNSIELDDIMKRRFELKDRYLGISILGGNKNCRYCTGNTTDFKWEKINSLPKLPKYPGCICIYLSLRDF